MSLNLDARLDMGARDVEFAAGGAEPAPALLDHPWVQDLIAFSTATVAVLVSSALAVVLYLT